MSPNEQKTQQSPSFARKTVWQPEHSWKNWQASIGISRSSANPHWGHFNLDLVVGCTAFLFQLRGSVMDVTH
jgi:hypothetical protein